MSAAFCRNLPLSAQSSFEDKSNIHFAKSVLHVPKNFSPEVIMIAIKPQQIPEALPDYQRYRSATFISLAAGTPASVLKTYLGQDTVIARIMPNIAIKVHASLNLAFMPDNLLPFKKNLITVCKNSGNLMWLSKEKSLDELTVISGSGPAYFYLLMEALVKNAMEYCSIRELNV